MPSILRISNLFVSYSTDEIVATFESGKPLFTALMIDDGSS
jgi:hypothetical protein